MTEISAFRMILVLAVTVFAIAVVYEAMSAGSTGHCYVDPAFGSCSEAPAVPAS